MNDWNIQSRANACEACGQSFVDRQPYHTLLFDERQDFRRQDVCTPCWQKQFSDGARERKGFISYWQGMNERSTGSLLAGDSCFVPAGVEVFADTISIVIGRL